MTFYYLVYLLDANVFAKSKTAISPAPKDQELQTVARYAI